MSGENARSTKRYPVHLKCVYGQDGREWEAILKDISIDGAFVESDPVPTRGSMIKLVFAGESGQEIQVTARVMYKSALTPDRVGCGLYFTEFKGNSLRRLDRYLASLPDE